MILVRRQPFDVSRYHVRAHPELASSPNAPGPVLRAVRIHFKRWFNERQLRLDVFVDPGADATLLSARWLEAQGGTGPWKMPRVSNPYPERRNDFLLEEDATIELGGASLSLGAGVGIPAKMPGYEDMLLGRDFLSAHGLLLVIDGEEKTFSLLHPADEENRKRRGQIRYALNEPDALSAGS